MSKFIIVSLLLSVAVHATAQAEEAKLQAGAAAVDVTPKEFPLNLPGGFSANMATKVHDPLHSRAVVFSDGRTTLAMVVVDNLGVSPEAIEEAKVIASEKTDIPTEKMLICSTHTHSAPRSSQKDGDGPEAAYRRLLVHGMVQSIVDAHAALEPAAVGYATHPLPEEVFNRRWYLKPNKMPLNPFGGLDQVKMNPGRSPDVLDRPAGPTDPDIAIISVQTAQRKPLALFANYALHYVGGVPRGTVSSDYFGEFARLMPSRLKGGEEFVAMMSNGASGDINNIPFTVTRPPREPFEQIGIVARKAADTAWFAHRKIEAHTSDATIDMVQRELTLTYRKPTDEQIQEARAILAIKDEGARARLPRLAEPYARRTITASERDETLTIKLQAIRIGEFAVVGIPFETFVEIGMDIKDESPFPQTMVIGLANGRHGYLPTPRQHLLGGYETWLGTSIVQKDASDLITKELLEMLGELVKQR